MENFSQKFEYVGQYNEGLAPAKQGGKWGFINEKGEAVIPFIYEWTNDFLNGLGTVKLDNRFGFVNKVGEVIGEIKYSDACNVGGRSRIMTTKGRKGVLEFNPETEIYKEVWD